MVSAIRLLAVYSLLAQLTIGPARGAESAGSPALASVVDKAVNEWSASTSVNVTASAKGAISSGLSVYADKLASPTTAEQFTKAYLYELRDAKRLKGNRNLDLSDVERYSPMEFAKASLYARVGFLKCSSRPYGGRITIDGQVRGNTVKEFVLSTGEHAVVITLAKQQCEQRVNVEEGRTVEAHCPTK